MKRLIICGPCADTSCKLYGIDLAGGEREVYPGERVKIVRGSLIPREKPETIKIYHGEAALDALRGKFTGPPAQEIALSGYVCDDCNASMGTPSAAACVSIWGRGVQYFPWEAEHIGEEPTRHLDLFDDAEREP